MRTEVTLTHNSNLNDLEVNRFNEFWNIKLPKWAVDAVKKHLPKYQIGTNSTLTFTRKEAAFFLGEFRYSINNETAMEDVLESLNSLIRSTCFTCEATSDMEGAYIWQCIKCTGDRPICITCRKPFEQWSVGMSECEKCYKTMASVHTCYEGHDCENDDLLD